MLPEDVFHADASRSREELAGYGLLVGHTAKAHQRIERAMEAAQPEGAKQ